MNTVISIADQLTKKILDGMGNNLSIEHKSGVKTIGQIINDKKLSNREDRGTKK
jgi:hypothetical protein